jgi:Ni,Fe-hydrogenase III small subunit
VADKASLIPNQPVRAFPQNNCFMSSLINHDKGNNEHFGESEKRSVPTRPVITDAKVDQLRLKAVCPVHAIGANPARIDLGKCVFCGQCEQTFPTKIHFTEDAYIASNVRERLIVIEGENMPIRMDESLIRDEIGELLTESISLMHLFTSSADMSNIGNIPNAIQIVHSPQEAHGVIITGHIGDEFMQTLENTYSQLKAPRLIIVAGQQALSSEIFETTLQGKINNKYQIDLFIPGDPYHPKTLEISLRQLIQSRKKLKTV